MIFSRCMEDFTTRLTLNNDKIDRKPINYILGVWLTEDAGNWQKNLSKMCKKAYGRVSMLTKRSMQESLQRTSLKCTPFLSGPVQSIVQLFFTEA